MAIFRSCLAHRKPGVLGITAVVVIFIIINTVLAVLLLLHSVSGEEAGMTMDAE